MGPIVLSRPVSRCSRAPDGQISNRLDCAILPSAVQYAAKIPARRNQFHQPIQRDLGRPVRTRKIIRFSISANPVLLPSSRLMKRGVRVVTIRGVRVAVDAMALRARGIAGRSRASSWGCERSIRAGRAALLRTAKACGSGTRGWCQAGGGCSNPTGFVGPSIRQRRRQEEFVSGKSAP